MRVLSLRSPVAASTGVPPSPLRLPVALYTLCYGSVAMGFTTGPVRNRVSGLLNKGNHADEPKNRLCTEESQAFRMRNEVYGREYASKTEPRNAWELRAFTITEPAQTCGNGFRVWGIYADPLSKKMLKPSDSEYHTELGKHI